MEADLRTTAGAWRMMLPGFVRKLIAQLDRDNLVKEARLTAELRANKEAAEKEAERVRRLQWLTWEGRMRDGD